MISIIIPTYNEKSNILRLIPSIHGALSAWRFSDYEVLVMDDDSPDGTAGAVQSLGDPRARAINRAGRPRGLSYAVIDGFKEAAGDVYLVMDADLSHPASVLPLLIAGIQEGAAIVVASRYIKGGGVENWPFKRRLASRVACWMARFLTPVRDATSGFFAIRKDVIQGVTLNPLGFKIGLEVFVRSRHQGRTKEVPYIFKDREEGQSKLSGPVMLNYLKQLLLLTIRR